MMGFKNISYDSYIYILSVLVVACYWSYKTAELFRIDTQITVKVEGVSQESAGKRINTIIEVSFLDIEGKMIGHSLNAGVGRYYNPQDSVTISYELNNPNNIITTEQLSSRKSHYVLFLFFLWIAFFVTLSKLMFPHWFK
ncbi:MAG: hypothetical protein AAF740_00345 [Bacteroidota bacterium]